MAWSFGHWLILIVALVVGAAGGWFWRGRQDAATATHGSPMVDGDPVAGMTAVVVDPPPVATLDEARPEVTVDPRPDAVADRVPAAPGADAPTDADPATAPSATVVTADASRADDVDPADMALTGDPVPAPVTDPAPPATAADARPDHEIVLPAAAEVTGPVDHRPAQEPAPAVEPRDVPAATQEPAPVAVTPTPADVTGPEIAPAAAEPESTPVVPVEPDTAPAAAEPATAAAEVDVPATATATAATAPVESEPTPVGAVVVPAPRGEVTAPPAADSDSDSAAADDFRRIQGVGPKMAAALQAAGIRTYRQLAELDEAALRETIRAAGLRAAPSLATWPQQAKVLAGAPQEAATALPTPVGGTDA
ncbi:helix-hairpin-helix domain-containing protein [Micromonospora echinofusca]|uniref:helix-hairpin-helix domain-containing protein n=1 Tax=Micromonospora echinofusca TaxID=47858 RepID=UPI0033EAC011